MSDHISINNESYTLVRLVAERFEYSQDYITRLARERKVKALRRGRYWYVHSGSVQSYAEVQQAEQRIRRKLLHAKRRHERLVRSATAGAVKKDQTRRDFSHAFGLAACGFVILCGGLLGVALQSHVTTQEQLASVATAGLVGATAFDAAAPAAELIPVFSSGKTVQVAPGRVIENPAAKGVWSVAESVVTE